MQTQTKTTQTQDLETQNIETKKQKILEKITEELLKRSWWKGRDLENLIAARLWGLGTYGSESKGTLERIIELGYDPEDINVDRVWHNSWDPDALDIIIVLPNGAEKKISVIPKKPVSTLSKSEYELVKREVEKYEERRKIKELEDEVRNLQRELEWYKNEKKTLEEKLARLEEELKELNGVVEEFREYLITLEKEEDFIEWLAEKRYKQGLEQLKEQLKEQFFPNEYDDC